MSFVVVCSGSVALGCSSDGAESETTPSTAGQGGAVLEPLIDSETGLRTCLEVLPATADVEILVAVFSVLGGRSLPSVLAVTGIVAESRLGYDFEPVFVTYSGGIPPDAAVLTGTRWDDDLVTAPLPATPQTDSFAVGAIVRVPGDSEITPDEPALVLTGIEYAFGGNSYTQSVNNVVWFSRMRATTPDFCPGLSERIDAIDEEFGFE